VLQNTTGFSASRSTPDDDVVEGLRQVNMV